MWDLGRGWVVFKGRLRLDGLFFFRIFHLYQVINDYSISI